MIRLLPRLFPMVFVLALVVYATPFRVLAEDAKGFVTTSSLPAAPRIHVFSCQVMSGPLMPRKDDVGLAVRFRNDTADALNSIVWRAKYGNGTVDFVDDGMFSHDIRIDNFVLAEQGSSHLNWVGVAADVLLLTGHPAGAGSLTKSNLALPEYMSTADPENCSVARATFNSGETWVNPELVQQSAMLTAPTPLPARIVTPNMTQTDSLEPMQFSHCTLMVQVKSELEVVFRNASTQVADRFVIRASYGKSGIDFVDEGTFAPGALVKHLLKKPLSDELEDQAYTSLDDPRDCVAVSAHFADGSTWQNPSVSATPGPLPTAVPDAIILTSTHLHWAHRHGFATPVPTPSEAPAAPR